MLADAAIYGIFVHEFVRFVYDEIPHLHQQADQSPTAPTADTGTLSPWMTIRWMLCSISCLSNSRPNLWSQSGFSNVIRCGRSEQ